MRSKADAIDYKYFVEPNIPKFKIDPKWVEEIIASTPELPYDRKVKYINELGLSNYDATIIIKDIKIATYFEKCVELGVDAKTAANWICTQILGYCYKEEKEIDQIYLTPERLAQITAAIKDGRISSKQGKELFNLTLEREEEPEAIMEAEGMKQLSDDSELIKIVSEILDRSEAQIADYKNGKTNIIGYFVGQVMQATKGQANPGKVNQILQEEISKR